MKKMLSVMMAVIAVACAVSCDKDNGRKVIPVKNITYNYDDLTDGGRIIMYTGESVELNVSVDPANATDTLLWSSEQTDVADIFSINDEKGHSVTLSALSEGTGGINVNTKSGFHSFFFVDVFKAPVELESIDLDVKEMTLNYGGASNTSGCLEMLLYPEGADYHSEEISWIIEDESVLEIDQEEDTRLYFSTKKIGKTRIIAKYGENMSAYCDVNVVSSYVSLKGVSLSNANYKVMEGEQFSIQPVFSPSNATNKSMRWVVQDASIVKAEGCSGSISDFTALSVGTTTLVGTSVDGQFSVTANVTVTPPPTPAGAVDLGYRDFKRLPVFFAECNLEASDPAVCGFLYAWGETEPHYFSKSPYAWKPGYEQGYVDETYKWYDKKTKKYTKYVLAEKYGVPDGKSMLDDEDNVVKLKMGGKWTIPSAVDWFWVKNNCTYKEDKRNGIKGLTFTSKVPGFEDKSIFLPYTGYLVGTDNLADGEFETFMGDHIYMGCYQSSILNHSNNDHFFGFVFYKGDLYIRGEYRCLGEALRPVWYGYAD